MRRYLCALTCPIECTCRHEYWNFYFDLERETLGKNNGYCYYVSLWPISKKAMIGKQLCEIGIMLFTMTDHLSDMPWSCWLSSDLEQNLLWYSDPYRFLSTPSFFCYRLPSSLQMHHHLSRRVQREKERLHPLQSPRYPLQSSKSLYTWHGIFWIDSKADEFTSLLWRFDTITMTYICLDSFSLGSFTHSRHCLVLLFPLLTYFCCKRFETLRDCHVYPNLRISLFHTVRYDFHQIQCNFPFPSDFVDCIHIAYIMSYLSCWLCLVFVAVLLGLTNSPQVLTGCNPTDMALDVMWTALLCIIFFITHKYLVFRL